MLIISLNSIINAKASTNIKRSNNIMDSSLSTINATGAINKTLISEEIILFHTREVEDNTLPKSVRIVEQEGVNGKILEYSKTVLTKNEMHFEETPYYFTETIKPVEEIVRVGTNDTIIEGVSEEVLLAEEKKKEEEKRKEQAKIDSNNRKVSSDTTDGQYTSPEENREYAKSVLSEEEFVCADTLVMRESGWKTNAENPSSGAYGVPQSLPASKLASAGDDWRTNGITQFNWMISYVKNRYQDSFCVALDHSYLKGWY